MIEIDSYEKDKILSSFPFNIKLSYENITHKKVLNFDVVSVIPLGKKCFIWFTLLLDKPICYLLKIELNKNNKDNFISKKNITNIYILSNYSFDFSLSYGTILYGTMFHNSKQGFFSIEDIYYNQGINIFHEEYYKKLVIIKRILSKKINISSVALQKSSLIIGLPIISVNFEEIIEKIKILPYKIYCLIFRKDNLVFKMPFYNLNMNLNNDVMNSDKFINNNLIILNKNQIDMKINLNNSHYSLKKEIILNKNQIDMKINLNNSHYSLKKEIILKVRPDIQNDIYHLFCLDDNELEYYIDVAFIPDYKTSVFMNNLFRIIKENNNLDYLEESDEENEFENEKEDRFVYLDKEKLMICKYNYKFKKWVPIKEVISNKFIKPVFYKDLLNQLENKNYKK